MQKHDETHQKLISKITLCMFWLCKFASFSKATETLPKVIAKDVFPLIQAKQRFQGKVMIHFRTLGLEKETLYAVKEILAANKGNNDTRLHFISPDNEERVVTVSDDLRIQPSDEVIEQIQSLLGEDAILFE